ncbi:4-hydroxy-tetrahydrodipicolinate synthase [Pontibacter flavimaris]|uniref:4-hydroxy-tetrahydrodipicolinate synthase n=1 Tax=Pontibacter flavimaris TaxID=1797110 RepID=A0A1Q5PBK4_9BACT|nr:4-hydroxy-tetrahydrodipicolinate synthase [Pontibacter flavimaris]OKL39608.1 4-hydroxy-tetrahydrodipicolinate synthase [Pontibacter flavimaris]
MIQDKLRGTGVALVTPFTKEYAVDYDALRKLLDFVLDGGVDYLVINGTTAESATTTAAERAKVLQQVKEHVSGRVPLVYGLGGNNTQELLISIAETNLEGITAILSVSPYYNKPSQQGIYQHFVQVANASPVPVILYNVPGRTGSNMSGETTVKLASHDNIIAIKEASGNLEQCMYIAKHKPEDFMLISGDDLLAVPMTTFGAQGVISVLANAFPGKFSNMVRHALGGNYQEASALLLSFADVNPLMYEESNPVGVKAVLERFGVCTAQVRLPLVEASPGLKDRLYKLL